MIKNDDFIMDNKRFIFEIMFQGVNMSDQEFEQAKVEIKARAKEVYEAALIIVMDGKPITTNWIEDVGDATKKWEKCTIKLRVQSTSRNYMDWVDIELDDGTVLFSTKYHTGDGFDVVAFRNGAWVERFITYATEGLIADQERQKKAELAEKLKPFSEIDF